ncbi:MAG TPA: hypothetical protein VIK73_01915 [Limnochordales bacterium]
MDELLAFLIWVAIAVLGALRNASQQRSRPRPPEPRRPQARPRPPQARRPRPSSRPRSVEEGPPPVEPIPTLEDEGVSFEWQWPEATGPRLVAAAQERPPLGGSSRPPAASAWAWAMVMAEVLGPPRALRPYRSPVNARWRHG